jgi:hypothetical protein
MVIAGALRWFPAWSAATSWFAATSCAQRPTRTSRFTLERRDL